MANSKQMTKKKARTTGNSQRYHEIVRIAGDLFAEKGFDGTSLHDLASAVGVLKGSLYHWIDSKESLLYDVVKLAHRGLFENIEIADHFASDPLRQLAAFSYGHIVLNAVPERLNRGIVFLFDSRKLKASDSERVLRDRDTYDQYIRSIVRRGISTGAFDKTLDTRLSSFAILGVMTSYLRWFKPDGPISPHELAREFSAFVLTSVAPAAAVASSRHALVDEISQEVDALVADLNTARKETDLH